MAGRLPGSRMGKTLGLSVSGTWAHLFEQNEARYEARQGNKRAPKPLTDAQITEFMKQEFPLTDEQRKWLEETGKVHKAFDYPTGKRSRYNSGKLAGMSGPPERPSHRYDEDGNRVEGYRPRAAK